MDKLLNHLIDLVTSLLIGMTPAALGASVSLAYERGLSWSERAARLFVGIIVSFFASRSIGALWPWGMIDPFVQQGISFTLGMIAYKATPPFVSQVQELVVSLPAWFRRRFLHDGKPGGDGK